MKQPWSNERVRVTPSQHDSGSHPDLREVVGEWVISQDHGDSRYGRGDEEPHP